MNRVANTPFIRFAMAIALLTAFSLIGCSRRTPAVSVPVVEVALKAALAELLGALGVIDSIQTDFPDYSNQNSTLTAIGKGLAYEKLSDFMSARKESENVMSNSRSGGSHQGLSDLAGAKINNFHKNEDARNNENDTPGTPTLDTHDINDQGLRIGPSTGRLLLFASMYLLGAACWLYSKFTKSRKK